SCDARGHTARCRAVHRRGNDRGDRLCRPRVEHGVWTVCRALRAATDAAKMIHLRRIRMKTTVTLAALATGLALGRLQSTVAATLRRNHGDTTSFPKLADWRGVYLFTGLAKAVSGGRNQYSGSAGAQTCTNSTRLANRRHLRDHPGVFHKSSLGFTQGADGQLGADCAPPIIRTRSAIKSGIARICAACSSNKR